MRSHYLLGKDIRKRYVDTGFLSDHYDPKELFVESTQVDRTIQSVQSQLLGIYDLGSASTLKKVQQDKALPPIEISDKDEVLKSLGDKAAEGGF